MDGASQHSSIVSRFHPFHPDRRGTAVSWRGTSSRFRAGARGASPVIAALENFRVSARGRPPTPRSGPRRWRRSLAQTNSTAQRTRDSIDRGKRQEREGGRRINDSWHSSHLKASLRSPIDDWGWIISPTNKRGKRQVRPPDRSRTLRSEHSFGGHTHNKSPLPRCNRSSAS